MAENQNRVCGTSTGSVTFLDEANNLGTVTLHRGKATLKTLGLQVGKNQIRVEYTPDTGFNSSSATIVENVQQRR
jgi:hypothetical protein